MFEIIKQILNIAIKYINTYIIKTDIEFIFLEMSLNPINKKGFNCFFLFCSKHLISKQ